MRKEDELERVVREYKENVPRAAAVEAAQEQANKALDLLEKTTASKNMLLAKLDGSKLLQLSVPEVEEAGIAEPSAQRQQHDQHDEDEDEDGTLFGAGVGML